MKTLAYVQIKDDSDNYITDATTKQTLDTLSLSIIALNNARYNNLEDIEKGLKLRKILKEATAGLDLGLEDADYEFLKRVVLAHEPYKNGLFLSSYLLLFK